VQHEGLKVIIQYLTVLLHTVVVVVAIGQETPVAVDRL
jgi:hypothetical protein